MKLKKDKIDNECRSDVESYLDSEMKSSPNGSILRPFIIGLLHQLSKGYLFNKVFTSVINNYFYRRTSGIEVHIHVGSVY